MNARDACAESPVTVVVVTRNRDELLRRLMEALRKDEWRGVPVHVVDDASDVPFALDSAPPEWRLTRNPTRRGLVASRNEANFAASTRYALSLDDDSWPVAGNWRDAVEHLDRSRDVLALTFPIRRPGERWQVASRQMTPYPVKGFIGCAHLVHLGHFRALGGYSTAVVHQGEEFELAARAYARGLRCVHFPDLVIHHEHTGISRDMRRVLYHGARNKARFVRAFCPARYAPWFQFRALVEMMLFAVRHRRAAPLRGWASGLAERLAPGHVARFDPPAWRRWRTLPYA